VAIKNGTWSSDIFEFGIRSSYKAATLQFSITPSYCRVKPIFQADCWSTSNLFGHQLHGRPPGRSMIVVQLKYGIYVA
jgi:hypothetical protein